MAAKGREHSFHKIIGAKLNASIPESFKVIRDQACGGDQQIPLFSESQKLRNTQLCKVDLLITKNDQISVIIEIAETDLKPTHVYGKFLTSALASFYIQKTKKNKPIPMAESVLFVQIVDMNSLSLKSRKFKQLYKIEQNIGKILPINGSRINKYRLSFIDSAKPEKKIEELVNCILEHLNMN